MRGSSRTEALMPVLSADDEHEEQINIAYESLTPSVIEDEKAQSYIEALILPALVLISEILPSLARMEQVKARYY